MISWEREGLGAMRLLYTSYIQHYVIQYTEYVCVYVITSGVCLPQDGQLDSKYLTPESLLQPLLYQCLKLVRNTDMYKNV